MKLIALLLSLVLLLDTGGIVQNGGADLLFPQAIQFSANLTIPASDLIASTLTLDAEGWDGVTLDIDTRDVVLDAGELPVRLLYEWRASVDDPPPLFAELGYRWDFTASDGSTGTLDGTITYANPRAAWVRLDDPAGRFNLTLPDDLSLNVASLRDVHHLLGEHTGTVRRYNLIAAPFPLGCAPRADGVLVARSAVTSAETICDDGIDPAVYARYATLEIPADADVEQAFAARLVGDAYSRFWGGGDLPDWFTAGLTRFYAPSADSALLLVARQASRDRALFSLDAMAAAQDDPIWQAQSYGMVLYIVDQLGIDGLVAFARSDMTDFAAAYQSAVGQPLAALIPAYSQWVFTRAAERAYGVTPYQPPTAAPPPTETATNTPSPTLTPTDLPTVSWTPSVTPRGLRTYVPPPTATPSETNTPPPATVTPRPPGSLQDAPGGFEITPGLQAGILTFLILLLGLFVFLLIRQGNRR